MYINLKKHGKQIDCYNDYRFVRGNNMIKNSYKNAIILYIIQMVLIVMLLNNNFMKSVNVFQPKNDELLRLLLGIVIFILNIVSIFVLRDLYIKGKEEQQLIVNSVKFKYIEEQNRIYRRIRHDLRNHIIILSELAKEKRYKELDDYLSSYMEEIDKSLITVSTGANEIDILFYSKINSAREKDITVDFKCSTEIKCANKHVLNLVSILGNVLDNAIEACDEMRGNKIITVSISDDPLDYIFQITNPYNFKYEIAPEILFQEGFSTKQGDGRGEGLYIVKKIVQKYQGEVNIKIDDGYFNIKIEIPKYKLEGDNY